jgi:hypothetical protein
VNSSRTLETTGNAGYAYATYWPDLHRSKTGLLSTVGYPAMGEGFNSVTYRLRLAAAQRALRGCGIEQVSSVIEAAVGVGAYAPLWKHLQVSRWIGVDISEAAIADLGRRFPKAKFVQEDICSDQLGERLSNETAELVTAIDVLYHIEDDALFARALRNLAARVPTKGALLLSDVFSEEPRWVPPVVKRRPLATYQAILGDLGLELVRREPIFAILGDPVVRTSRPWQDVVLFNVWRVLSKAIRVAPSAVRGAVGWLVAWGAMPADAALRRMGTAQGVNLEMAVFRRKPDLEGASGAGPSAERGNG